MENMRRPRQKLSEGMEHVVYRGRNPNLVLKLPRRANRLTFLGTDPVKTLKNELANSESLIEETDIRIPRTRIFPLQEGYVIAQRYIEKDHSIPDISAHLTSRGLEMLAREQIHEPRNFIDNNGTVYWVDPTLGLVGRVLERCKIMNIDQYRTIRLKMSKVIRKVGL